MRVYTPGEENKKLLLDLHAVDPLLHLMQGEDVTVRRHATMALGVMCQHREYCSILRLYVWSALLLAL